MDKDKMKIFIADDHPLILKGIIDTINVTPDYKVIGDSTRGRDALKLIDELNPDIAILDINMSDTSGLEVAEKIKEKKPDIKIIILTMYNDENYFNKAIDIGVDAYLLKDCYANEIIKCLDEVHAGGFYLSPGVSKYLIKRKKDKSKLFNIHTELKNLTSMEKKILIKVSQNKTSKEIADELFISIRTVQNHRTNICYKLNLKGYNKLLQFAILNRHILEL